MQYPALLTGLLTPCKKQVVWPYETIRLYVYVARYYASGFLATSLFADSKKILEDDNPLTCSTGEASLLRTSYCIIAT